VASGGVVARSGAGAGSRNNLVKNRNQQPPIIAGKNG